MTFDRVSARSSKFEQNHTLTGVDMLSSDELSSIIREACGDDAEGDTDEIAALDELGEHCNTTTWSNEPTSGLEVVRRLMRGLRYKQGAE